MLRVPRPIGVLRPGAMSEAFVQKFGRVRVHRTKSATRLATSLIRQQAASREAACSFFADEDPVRSRGITVKSANGTSSKTGDTARVEHGLRCVECHVPSDEGARGWRGVLTGDEYEPTTVAIYCPECADREFGPPQQRLQIDEE